MTSMAPANGAPWQVTGQRQASWLPAGASQIVQGVEVSFVTATGATGSVSIPYSQFTPAYVSQAIDARAQVLDQVAGLNGPIA